MKKNTVIKDDEGITKEDIDKAIEIIIQNTSLPDEAKKSKSRKVIDDEKHIIFQHKPDPNSPYEYVREGKPLKIKTVFHAIENEIEDIYGGKLSYTYSMRATAEGLFNLFRENFPSFSKSDIEDVAKPFDIDFAAAKRKTTLRIAEKFILARIEMAKFLHRELEPTLKIALSNLIDDAFLFGSKDLGQLVNGTQQFEQALKPYLNYRKQRTKVVRNVGRQKGEKEKVYSQDCELLKGKILSAMKNLATQGKIQKRKIAETLWSDIKYGNKTNGHQKLTRELKKCGLHYDEILEEFYRKFNI